MHALGQRRMSTFSAWPVSPPTAASARRRSERPARAPLLLSLLAQTARLAQHHFTTHHANSQFPHARARLARTASHAPSDPPDEPPPRPLAPRSSLVAPQHHTATEERAAPCPPLSRRPPRSSIPHRPPAKEVHLLFLSSPVSILSDLARRREDAGDPEVARHDGHLEARLLALHRVVHQLACRSVDRSIDRSTRRRGRKTYMTRDDAASRQHTSRAPPSSNHREAHASEGGGIETPPSPGCRLCPVPTAVPLSAGCVVDGRTPLAVPLSAGG